MVLIKFGLSKSEAQTEIKQIECRPSSSPWLTTQHYQGSVGCYSHTLVRGTNTTHVCLIQNSKVLVMQMNSKVPSQKTHLNSLNMQVKFRQYITNFKTGQILLFSRKALLELDSFRDEVSSLIWIVKDCSKINLKTLKV